MNILGMNPQTHIGKDVRYRFYLEFAGRYIVWDDVYNEPMIPSNESLSVIVPSNLKYILELYRRNRELAGLDLPYLSVVVFVQGKETTRLPVEW